MEIFNHQSKTHDFQAIKFDIYYSYTFIQINRYYHLNYSFLPNDIKWNEEIFESFMSNLNFVKSKWKYQV